MVSSYSCREYDKLCKSNDKLKSELTACEQRDTRLRQDLKNGSSQLKKTRKLLEKEKEKLQDFEATPERSEREIKESETKLKILRVYLLHDKFVIFMVFIYF